MELSEFMELIMTLFPNCVLWGHISTQKKLWVILELSYNYLIFFYNISSPWRNYELSLNCLRSVLLQSYYCLRAVSLYSSTPLPRWENIEIIFQQSLNCLAKVFSGLLCLSFISEENLAIYYPLDHLKLSYLCIRTVFILKLKQFCSVL